MGQRLLETLVLQQVGGVEGFVLVGQLIGDAVALSLGEEVFRLVVPVELGVALCHAHTAFGHHARLVAEQTGDVGIGGGSLEELALLELCLGHQQPDVVHEGVVFLLGIPLFVFFRQRARFPLGLGLDGVEFRGLLGFFNRLVEVARAHLAGGGAADDVEGDDLHVVVLVSLLLRLYALLVGFVAVVIDVETGDERLVETRLRRVVLGASAARKQRGRNDCGKQKCCGRASFGHVVFLLLYIYYNNG